jgi:hypothetical protein
MALEIAQFRRIVEAANPSRPVKLLSLGYPDLLLTAADLAVYGLRDLPIVPDSDKIAAWHSWPGPIYDTTEVFRRLFITPTYIDIKVSRGVEDIVDLNQPLEFPEIIFEEKGIRGHDGDPLIGAFDIVLDPGTLEHCFNIGQAFLNVAAMVAPGGTIIHTNPLSCQNHGFFNLCPTLYADFYGQNGFTIEYLGAMAGPVGNRIEAPLPPAGRIRLEPEVWSLVVVKAPTQWNGHAKIPTQAKYVANPSLKA